MLIPKKYDPILKRYAQTIRINFTYRRKLLVYLPRVLVPPTMVVSRAFTAPLR